MPPTRGYPCLWGQSISLPAGQYRDGPPAADYSERTVLPPAAPPGFASGAFAGQQPRDTLQSSHRRLQSASIPVLTPWQSAQYYSSAAPSPASPLYPPAAPPAPPPAYAQ